MKAIISAGGRGTRMRPLTFSTNKHLIPLANKPLIFYAIETVAAAGIKDIILNYNPGQLEELKGTVGTGRRWGVKIQFALQEKASGLADIIRTCQPLLGQGKFLMHLGDNIFHGGIKSLVDYFQKSDLAGLVTVLHHPENWRLGVPYFNKQGRLVKYVEKPKNPPHDLGIPGLYFFSHQVFDCFKGKDAIKPSARGEYEISAPYQWLLDHGHKVETKEFTGTWKDPGKFNDWLDTNQFLLDQNLEKESLSKLGQNVKIEGRVKIGKHCRIQNSSLRGPVIIGDGVTIKDSFIGSYASVADGCHLENAKIENSVLMKNVIVKNCPRLLDTCVVGEESLIEGGVGPQNGLELFLGNKCQIKL